jgi:hypothetical protein
VVPRLEEIKLIPKQQVLESMKDVHIFPCHSPAVKLALDGTNDASLFAGAKRYIATAVDVFDGWQFA